MQRSGDLQSIRGAQHVSGTEVCGLCSDGGIATHEYEMAAMQGHIPVCLRESNVADPYGQGENLG